MGEREGERGVSTVPRYGEGSQSASLPPANERAEIWRATDKTELCRRAGGRANGRVG